MQFNAVGFAWKACFSRFGNEIVKQTVFSYIHTFYLEKRNEELGNMGYGGGAGRVDRGRE
jgi:hypothetical protein